MIFTRTGLSPTMAGHSMPFRLNHTGHWPGPRSLATTSGVSVDVLSSGYLDVAVPRVRLADLWIQSAITLRWGFPIRKSTDQRVLAPPRGLSQRATSFIASQCQGIHQMPLRRLIAGPGTSKPRTRLARRDKPRNATTLFEDTQCARHTPTPPGPACAVPDHAHAARGISSVTQTTYSRYQTAKLPPIRSFRTDGSLNFPDD